MVATHPALDVLLNEAGIMRNPARRRERGLDDVPCEVEANLSGPVRMVRQFLPHLRGRPEALIVDVSVATRVVDGLSSRERDPASCTSRRLGRAVGDARALAAAAHPTLRDYSALTFKPTPSSSDVRPR